MKKTAPPSRDLIRSRLKLKHLESQTKFREKHPHAHDYFKEIGLDLGKIRQHSTKLLAAGAIGGALLLPASTGDLKPNHSLPAESERSVKNQEIPLPPPIAHALVGSGLLEQKKDKQTFVGQLTKTLPQIVNRFAPPFLSGEEEKVIEKLITHGTGIPTKATLDGEHLNTTFGYIGAEQHLRRYIGDTIDKHSTQVEGMAPGLGAWGHFAENGILTKDVIEREKYYVAVQTLYLPDWNRRVKYLRDWYKWRKIIVVNADNGNAVVAVIGDAGPAAWTGKHFGGSPEVMHELGGPRYKKGKVILMFVDDPENKIPLGPVQYNQIPNNLVQSI